MFFDTLLGIPQMFIFIATNAGVLHDLWMGVVARDDDRLSIISIAAERAVGRDRKPGIEGLGCDLWKGHPIHTIEPKRCTVITGSISDDDISNNQCIIARSGNGWSSVIAPVGKGCDRVASHAYIGTLWKCLGWLKAAYKISCGKNDRRSAK